MERGSRVSSGRVQPILPVLCLPLSSPVFAWALLGLQCISKNVREGCKAKRSTEPRFLSALFQPIANLPLIAGPLPLRMQASGRKHREGAVTRSIRRSSILLRGAGLCVLLSLIAQSTAQNFNLPELEEYTQPDQCPALMALRQVKQVVQGMKQMEGAGVQICRTIGTQKLRNLDPYLMLDELNLPAKAAFAGFPDHPHRGFETCSIMLEGKMEHKDSAGNHGVIGPGGVQWMTAGRGIIHSEMPKVTDGILHGFQLWINLPAKDKMTKPRYQDYQASDIPTVSKPEDGMSVRVMAGESYGATGPIKMRNPGMLLDVRLDKGGQFMQPVPEEWNGFCYVYEGQGEISGHKAAPQQAVVLGPGDHMTAKAASDSPMKFLLIAGRPINEPVVQYGPFVMNTQEEIQQAFRDYQSGRLQLSDDNPWAD